MQAHNIIGIVEAAFDLSETGEEALRSIARAAAGVIARGPIAVAELDSDAPAGASRVWFERADDSYVSSFAEWQRAAPTSMHGLARCLGPLAVQLRTELCGLSARLQTLAHQVFPLCLLANTGDGGGLLVAFGNPELAEWRPARLSSFHDVAAHLAVA